MVLVRNEFFSLIFSEVGSIVEDDFAKNEIEKPFCFVEGDKKSFDENTRKKLKEVCISDIIWITMDLNQIIQPSQPWSPLVRKEIPFESKGVEAVPQYVYVDIHGAEIAELQRHIEELQERIERLEKQKTSQIFQIQFLDSNRLRLKQPISVSLIYSSDNNLWIVDNPELNIYGEGEDENQAIDDFKQVLEETYFGLKKDKENLGPELKKKWSILSKIVEEI